MKADNWMNYALMERGKIVVVLRIFTNFHPPPSTRYFQINTKHALR